MNLDVHASLSNVTDTLQPGLRAAKRFCSASVFNFSFKKKLSAKVFLAQTRCFYHTKSRRMKLFALSVKTRRRGSILETKLKVSDLSFSNKLPLTVLSGAHNHSFISSKCGIVSQQYSILIVFIIMIYRKEFLLYARNAGSYSIWL